MGWKAGSSDKSDTQAEEAASETAEEMSAGAEGVKSRGVKSKRGIFLILGGLIVAGLAAGWSWLRKLPKD